MTLLEIENLHAEVRGREIIKGLDLKINCGEVHAVMGPNGAGKTTLANLIMGNPNYKITAGKILFKGKNIVGLPVNERAKLGVFQSFQYPEEIPGVTVRNFLKLAYDILHPNEKKSVFDFGDMLLRVANKLKIDSSFLDRDINVGFSGGERKKIEILQLNILKPQLAVLDETDSGLDIDALKIVAKGVNNILSSGVSVLLITHYNRILEYINPNFVHVFVNGRIVKTGGPEIAKVLEAKGYESFAY
ncbi:Fe-S cluster assembly ATPase SufC [Mesoaciditoga lauensis]|uniref:Fe-S cluster assembly ATPase SufC n=1 Tax=Mesoaciditoga lauensis TaxID=1495039 RepID=UPI000562DF66|nr:Fe-S cluster assembly ATPase SufC [Mesoaciditoga lauensis]